MTQTPPPEPSDGQNHFSQTSHGNNPPIENLAKTNSQSQVETRQLFEEAIRRLHQASKEEDILKVIVEEARKVFDCDRVVVYSLDRDSYGVVVAESVAPSWSKALGRTIEDPCFESRYLEEYKNGRVRAIDNIYKAGMTSCYLEQLEKLEVKANLVAPILDRGRLFGLLVAHQCSGTRIWQQVEIAFLTQLAKQAGFLLDRAQNKEETARLQQQTETETQWTNLLADISQQLYQSRNEEDILKASVREVRRVLNCDRVVVYGLNQDSYGVVIAESVAPGWTKSLGITIKDPCFEAKYLEKYKNGRVKALNNIYESGMTPCYIEQLEKLEVKANLVAPILDRGKIFGLLVAHQCSSSREWKQHEIAWMAQVAMQVGFALDNAKLLAERDRLQQQAETETQWTQYFTDAIQYIRQSPNEEDILKASVREVRRVLNCDRVVVYGLNQDSYGVVIAESVAPGWTKSLGITIKDPCFEAKYLEKYKNGRVKALNNIYESGMTPCYIEQLEKLEVKANLVAPILNEGKLFGLLVAHQCSEVRDWKQYEIRWAAQIATQVGFALDNAKLLNNSSDLQKRSDSETQWMQVLQECLQHLRQSSDREEILEATVEEARRILNCDRVLVYGLDRDSYGVVVAESVAPGWMRALGITINDPCFEVRYLEKYRNGRVKALNNIYEAGMTQCYIEQLEKLAVKANLVAPILYEGKVFGLLVAHQCSGARIWQPEEIEFLTRLAAQVGFVLEYAKLMSDREQLQKQVQIEVELTQYFTDAIQHIRSSLNQKHILEVSTEEVRRVLNCDRVVVYSLNRDSYGVVVAESVLPGYPKALGRTIEDPCFEARYLDKYKNGRVRALNNIREAGMTQCYIEQLEKLAVKANLVMPILNEGKLFGLLVAHQCSSPREWKQYEIRWVAQIATQVGFALDNATLLRQVKQSSQAAEHSSKEQHKQIELHKQEISEMLSQTDCQKLSTEALRQSEAIINILHKIQGVVDFARGVVFSAQQIKLQEQQANLTVQAVRETLNQSLDSISAIGDAFKDASVKVMRLSQSSQKLFEAVRTIKELAKQMTQQSMNVTIMAGRTGYVGQDSVGELAESVLSLTQKLVEATANIEPLFSAIELEIKELAFGMEEGKQRLFGGTEPIEETRQKLDWVMTVNDKTNALADKIAQAATKGVQTSTSASQSVQEVANLANQILEQSIAVTESFNKLAALTQKL
ncbi:GAF domain-containing protein [Pleurocapsa sp. PCC 7327]|uniref:GAF domain-containing protein n=1 Tax=Pleurocapsa sp. PCC 7327 TaxID=118163 RepID=UPI00029FB19E|nr:GAF domain-containing protein [Pleurocapsa sp. PCC 7327]AFY75555.1 GAF domain-containing protein [Pleurocapsa sp. PCC 7327]